MASMASMRRAILLPEEEYFAKKREYPSPKTSLMINPFPAKTKKGKKQDLDFRLKNACKDDGPEYRLSGMQFSMIQREPDGSGNMVKAFGKYVVPEVVAQDFDTDARGNVFWKDSTFARRPNQLADDKIKLKNKNQGEYVVFFQIEATHCTDPSVVIYLDPRIKNTGK